MMSDIQFSYDISPFDGKDDFTKNRLRIIPHTGGPLNKNDNVYIYFEIYNLLLDSPGDGRYKVEYEILKRDPADEEKQIREEYRERAQKEIDIVQDIYKDLVKKTERETIESTGKERAMQARGGGLGSTIGESAIERKKIAGREEVQKIGKEESLQIQQILNRADERAEQEIALKKQEAFKGATARLDYLKQVRDESRNDALTLAKSGVDLKQLKEDNKEYYDQFIEETGWTEFTFDAMYESNLPPKDKTQYQSYFKGDNLVMVGQDPKTGEIVTKVYKASDLGIPVGVNVDFITNENTGETFWYDKDNPELDAEGNLVLKSIGKTKAVQTDKGPVSWQEWNLAGGQAGTGKTYAQFLEGKGESNSEKLAASIQDMHVQLQNALTYYESVPTASGYKNVPKTREYLTPNAWKIAKKAWGAEEGLKAEDFIKEFYMYIDPDKASEYGVREANYLEGKESGIKIIPQ